MEGHRISQERRRRGRDHLGLHCPPDWSDGVEAVARRHAELAEIERQDEEVYRIYEISGEDRRAIEEELGLKEADGQIKLS